MGEFLQWIDSPRGLKVKSNHIVCMSKDILWLIKNEVQMILATGKTMYTIS